MVSRLDFMAHALIGRVHSFRLEIEQSSLSTLFQRRSEKYFNLRMRRDDGRCVTALQNDAAIRYQCLLPFDKDAANGRKNAERACKIAYCLSSDRGGDVLTVEKDLLRITVAEGNFSVAANHRRSFFIFCAKTLSMCLQRNAAVHRS